MFICKRKKKYKDLIFLNGRSVSWPKLDALLVYFSYTAFLKFMLVNCVFMKQLSNKAGLFCHCNLVLTACFVIAVKFSDGTSANLLYT